MRRFQVLLIVLAVAFFAASCTDLKSPTATYQKYEVTGIGLTSADIKFFFDVENPNVIPLGIKDIDYKLSLDGSQVLDGTFEGFSLQGKEIKTVEFPVHILYAGLIGQAANIAKKFIMREEGIAFKIEAEASVLDNFGFSARVPINAEGEIKLPKAFSGLIGLNRDNLNFSL